MMNVSFLFLFLISKPNTRHLESTEGETTLTSFLLQAGPEVFSASNITILIIIILLLLLLTAITAGAETAYFSLSAKDVNYLKTKDEASSRQAIHLLEQPKMLLATILVANNFINIAIVITTNMLIRQMLPPDISTIASFLIQVIAVTFLLVLYGEV